ncbi:DNA adenine methylase [Haemophilus influenzae]|nr:DNA adenine methylase [Haemophilus influenzae]
MIYCDPPYAPLQQETNFTGYAGNEFGLVQQRALADLAKSIQKEKQISILISNHDTKFTREIYNGAKFKRVKVQRSISQNPEKRVKVKELIAIFGARK